MKQKWKFIFITSVIVVILGFVLFMGILSEILAAYEKQEKENNFHVNTEGLPPFITQEMLEAAIQEQDTYGYPASVTVAQIIAESGFGRYGPGGDAKQGLSKLAYDYKNLFGMKAPAGDSTPIGVINMQTGEEYSGKNVTITAGFLIFQTYTDCIKYRSGLLQRRYSDLIKNSTTADDFAKSIASRWATDSEYGDKLIRHMAKYNLYRLDNMTMDDLGNLNGIDLLSAGQIRIRDIALSLNDQGCKVGMCQAWVANVYKAAGQNPRQSRACATEAGNAFIWSGSKENIPVGATVYGHSYNYNARCGNHDAGHVGIYVGNGLIVSRENKVQVKTLAQWTEVYGWRGWGWNGNEDFSKVQLGGSLQ